LAKDLNTFKSESLINLEKIKQSKAQILTLGQANLNFKDEIHLENIEVTKVEAQINSIENETDRLKNNIKNLDTEKNTQESKFNQDNKEIEENNISIDELTREKDEIQKTLDKVDFKLKDKLEEIESIKELTIDAKIKKAQIDEIMNNKQSEIKRLKEEMLVFSQKIITFSREIEEALQNKDISQCAVESAEGKVKEIKTVLEKMEKDSEENEIERIKIKEHIKISEDQLDNVSLMLEKTEKEEHKCELSLAKVEMQKDSYYLKLNEDFELTYAEALQFKSEIDDINSLEKEIVALKAAISKLGEINVSAIEEYKEVKEKFTFMNVQKEDLVLAKDELLTVIQEMTEKMKKIFAENFIILRQNFNETFMELFQGGSADLILTDGDELTAKIDINVQPPGKKLQNINLMSGGEKVLSAIALLFAILKMKPTPFCILDEIEAALDDANVVRYAEFLKRFADNVQFIIITHRKGTMEAGDVLYGVTMEEKGVSKIVSVDFKK